MSSQNDFVLIISLYPEFVNLKSNNIIFKAYVQLADFLSPKSVIDVLKQSC